MIGETANLDVVPIDGHDSFHDSDRDAGLIEHAALFDMQFHIRVERSGLSLRAGDAAWVAINFAKGRRFPSAFPNGIEFAGVELSRSGPAAAQAIIESHALFVGPDHYLD